MGIAGGIDLGGTKIEAQLFDPTWNTVDKRRVKTPETYPDLVDAIVDQISWLQRDVPNLPVGIAAAGMINPADGTAIAANLPSHGKPIPKDVESAIGGRISWLNDCRAFALAEAVFGAGSKQGTIVGLLLGTGIGGAVTIDGRLINDGRGQSGEFGHMPLPAELVVRHDLPLVKCGCGRTGCYETLGSGTGIVRLAKHLIGQDLSAEEISQGRHGSDQLAMVWAIWCEINASLIQELVFVVDPDTVVLGGGISKAPGLIPALETTLSRMAWPGFMPPEIRLGTRGETAAALGAGYSAWQEIAHG